MREVRSTIVIDAPPAAVWAVLTDLDAWSAWNPVMPSMQGTLAEGAKVALGLALPGMGNITVHGRFFSVDEPRRLGWFGGLKPLFQATHWLELTPEGQGCLVTHVEQFEGWFVGLLWGRIQATLAEAYPRMNEALKARVEGHQG